MKADLITTLAGLPDGDPRLSAVAAALADVPNRPATLRLLSMGDACARLGCSRATLWRLLKENRIRAVEVRRGSRRVPEAELVRFVEGTAGQ